MPVSVERDTTISLPSIYTSKGNMTKEFPQKLIKNTVEYRKNLCKEL